MDNETSILELTAEMLEILGFKVDFASEGNEAIKKYSAALNKGMPFDVVIMDLTIPGGLGGKDAVKKLLSLYPDAKVIVCSGYSTDPVMANYRDYGFKGRIIKPFQIDILKNELFTVLDESK